MLTITTAIQFNSIKIPTLLENFVVFFVICIGCCVFRNFYVVVVPLKRTSGTVKNLKNPDEMDMEEVGSL